MRIRWLRKALQNLTSEADYIARDDPAAAARTAVRIFEAVEQLVMFPALGRPGRVVGTRELVVTGHPTSFLIVFAGTKSKFCGSFTLPGSGRKNSDGGEGRPLR